VYKTQYGTTLYVNYTSILMRSHWLHHIACNAWLVIKGVRIMRQQWICKHTKNSETWTIFSLWLQPHVSLACHCLKASTLTARLPLTPVMGLKVETIL